VFSIFVRSGIRENRAVARVVFRLGVVLLVVCAVAVFGAGAADAQPTVYVFPSPGTVYNTPQSQITFRGISVNQLV
jgi:hypothetical protein